MRLLCIILLALISGCGGDDAASGFEQKSTGDALSIPPGCGSYENTEDEIADEGRLNALLTEQRWLPLRELYYQENGANFDLCEFFRTSPVDIVILQFASLSCYRCMKWIDETAVGLQDAEDASVYQHLIVARKRAGDLDEEWDTLERDIAPDARWVRDYNSGLWNFFAVSDQASTDPLTVVFSRAGRGFYLLDAALDFSALKTKIKEILPPPS